MNTTDVAWAAGFFDAEGSVIVRRRRRAWQLELEATQGGDLPPPVLHRFKAACDGHGSITGPRRGYLYYWRIANRLGVDAVASLLGPWISEPKRRELSAAFQTVNRPFALGLVPDLRPEHELAWAAGLFGGDGTTSAGFDKSGGPEYRRLKTSIPQAAVDGGVPPVLTRFHEAIGGIGSIGGPYVLKNPWSRLPQFVWSVSGARASERVLELIWQWLDDTKRHQARLAIAAARAGGPHRPLPPPAACFELD